MNILIIHNYYKNRGGEDIVFENETKALEKQSSVNVFSFSVNNQETEGGILHKLKFLCKILSGNREIRNEILKIIKFWLIFLSENLFHIIYYEKVNFMFKTTF